MGGKATAKKAGAKKPAKKAVLKTHVTAVSPAEFIAGVENEVRRKDAETLLKLFEKATGWNAKMWGPTIVGFGRYSYTYDSGHSGDAPVTGFSPRGGSLSIYPGIYPDQPEAQAILKALGKHKASKACVYINKLDDVDLKAFEKLIKAGVVNMKKVSKEKGWPLSAG
jgi:hypothetical protein